MAEPITLHVVNSAVFDGSSEIQMNRQSLQGRGPYYEVPITGGGVFDASFGGLVPSNNAKMVSIAALTEYPNVVAIATRGSTTSVPLRLIGLSPRYQRLFLAGEDVLRVFWQGPERERRLNVVVQDLGEQEVTDVMRVEQRPVGQMRRFTIRLPIGENFTYNTSQFPVNWTYTEGLHTQVADLASGAGHLTVPQLTEETLGATNGIYVWVKFFGLGVNTGDVGLQHWHSGETTGVATSMKSHVWTTKIWLAGPDRLSFVTTALPAGGAAGVEIDVSPVQTREV